MNATLTSSETSSITATARAFGRMNDESNLIERLRNGDKRAFESLVREFGGRMLSTARRFMRCEQDAADAVQEAFINAFRKMETFDGDSRLYTWLHRIVVNACLMKLRSRSRKPAISIDDCLPQFDSNGHHELRVSSWSGDGYQHAAASEMRERVRACIDQLPDSYRQILLLRDIEELGTEETAKLLGESIANVKTRLHRARQALRTLLEPVFTRE